MKNIFFLLALTSLSVSAQRMGLKAGANVGKERISDNGIMITSESSLFFMGGFFISDNLTDEVSLGAELLYSLDGGKFDLSNFGHYGTYTDRLHYLSIPVLIKYHSSKYFNIHAGPQVGYLLKAEEDNGMNTVDFTSDVKSINVSLVFGAEANLRAFDLGIRYILGMSNINDIPDTTFEVKLNTIQVYLGQTF